MTIDHETLAQSVPHLPPALIWFRDSWLGALMRHVPWLFEWCQAFHFIGLALLMGIIGVLDLRILGLAKQMPVGPIHRLLPMAFIGLGINALTGVAFFCAEPLNYAYVGDFQLKMALVLLAGFNALWFRMAIHNEVYQWGPGVDASPLGKAIAGTSLLLWTAILITGRFISFYGKG
jgi:hypothetical protein